MFNESILNPTLFIRNEKPMKFYLDKAFHGRGKCTIQSWSPFMNRIKMHGGIWLRKPANDAICLVDILHIYKIDKKSMHKNYDCRFVIDCIEKNQLLDLETYRITEQTSENESPIDKLDDICLAEIFLKLPLNERLKMEEVSENWKRASKLAWNDTTKLHFENIYYEYKNQFVVIEALLSRCGKYLTDLLIHEVRDSRIMKVISLCCPNLKKLDLELMEDYDSVEIFSKMEKLQSIKIYARFNLLSFNFSICSFAKNMIEPELGEINFFDALSFPTILPKTKFVNLHSLYLKCFNLTSNCMEAIGQATNLVSLTLKRCWLERLENVDLIFNLSNLEKLNIEEISDGVNEYVSDDVFLIKLAHCCKSLKILHLCNSDHVTDKGIETLLQMEKLTELYLESFLNPYITDVSVRKFRNLTVLGIVNCVNVSDTSIMELLEKLPNLKFLNVRGTGITVQTLDLADKITRIRKNDVELEILVSSYNIPYNFSIEEAYTSPLLKLSDYSY